MDHPGRTVRWSRSAQLCSVSLIYVPVFVLQNSDSALSPSLPPFYLCVCSKVFEGDADVEVRLTGKLEQGCFEVVSRSLSCVGVFVIDP